MNNNSRNSQRILLELKKLIKDPDVQSYFQYESSGYEEESQLFRIYGYLLPHTEPYKYGSFKVSITLSYHYPFQPPEFRLLTYMYHPTIINNVSNPHICEKCTCYTWCPSDNISNLLKHFVNVIDRPEASGSYIINNREAKRLYDENRAEYDKLALAMIKKYSFPRLYPSIISLKFSAKRMILKELDYESTKIDQLPLSHHLKQYLNKT